MEPCLCPPPTCALVPITYDAAKTESTDWGQGVKVWAVWLILALFLMPTMTADICGVGQVAMDILPDDVLLAIFSFYGEETRSGLSWWIPLLHVCRRWRQVIFGSPLSLHLRLLLHCNRPVRTSLDIWPPLPISITYFVHDSCQGSEEIFAALEHRDRVSEISFAGLTSSNIEWLAKAMLEPFPALTSLELFLSRDFSLAPVPVPVLPDAFLGGNAPSLRRLALDGIAFPALPKLLLSSTRLISLDLRTTPISGYISAQVMVTCLAAFPSLKVLRIENPSGWTDPDKTSLSPPTSVVLPSLTYFYFKGVSEYLEYLVARMDAPGLSILSITFYDDPISPLPQLLRFIDSIGWLGSIRAIEVTFDYEVVRLKETYPFGLDLAIMPNKSANHVSSTAAVCHELRPLLSRVKHLEFYGERDDPFFEPQWEDTDPAQWLKLFRPFVSVQSLHISSELARPIVHALQTLAGERAKKLLPELGNILLKGPRPSESVMQDLEAFTTMHRQLFDHPAAIQ